MGRSPTEVAPADGRGPGRATAGTAFEGHAFGIDLRADFEVAGLPPCPPLEVDGNHTRLQLTGQDELESTWSGLSPERLIEWSDERGPQGGLDHDREAGYRLAVKRYGTFVVSADGRLVRCATPAQRPSAAQTARWQECLLGQVLPLAAVLRGVEVLHASAVSIHDRAAIFVGASTAGKTSLAANLVARGARLVTDDVLGLRIAGSGLRCFPGAGLVSLRDAEASSMGDRWRRLGQISARGDDSTKLVVDRENRALALSGLYFLDRERRDKTRIEPLETSDPSLLLGSSFNFVVRDRARLVNQLDVCAALSALPQSRILIGGDKDAGALAEVVLDHLERP